jgi:hypothetical protein
MTGPAKASHREETREQQLAPLYAELHEASDRSLGYPCNLLFDYTPLYRFLEFHLNDIGDLPDCGSRVEVRQCPHKPEMERRVETSRARRQHGGLKDSNH